MYDFIINSKAYLLTNLSADGELLRKRLQCARYLWQCIYSRYAARGDMGSYCDKSQLSLYDLDTIHNDEVHESSRTQQEQET